MNVISFIKCLFQLFLYNPVKMLLSSVARSLEWQFSWIFLLAVILWFEYNVTYFFDTHNLWDVCTLPKTQMFKIWHYLLSVLGVFRWCHTHHIYGHTRHKGFSGIEKKNEPSFDIILLGIKAYISNTLIVINFLELTQPHSRLLDLCKTHSKLMSKICHTRHTTYWLILYIYQKGEKALFVLNYKST